MLLAALCVSLLSACGPEASDYVPDAGTLSSPMCSVDADCDSGESVPVWVRVQNDWDAADRFSVEHKYSGVMGQLMTEVPIGAYQQATSADYQPARAGAAMSFRIIRTVHLDSTAFYSFSVPADADPTSGAVFVFHLATSASTPACPDNLPNCVFGLWAGRPETRRLL